MPYKESEVRLRISMRRSGKKTNTYLIFSSTITHMLNRTKVGDTHEDVDSFGEDRMAFAIKISNNLERYLFTSRSVIHVIVHRLN